MSVINKWWFLFAGFIEYLNINFLVISCLDTSGCNSCLFRWRFLTLLVVHITDHHIRALPLSWHFFDRILQGKLHLAHGLQPCCFFSWLAAYRLLLIARREALGSGWTVPARSVHVSPKSSMLSASSCSRTVPATSVHVSSKSSIMPFSSLMPSFTSVNSSNHVLLLHIHLPLRRCWIVCRLNNQCQASQIRLKRPTRAADLAGLSAGCTTGLPEGLAAACANSLKLFLTAFTGVIAYAQPDFVS